MITQIQNIIREKLGQKARLLKKLDETNNQAYIVEFEDKQYIFKTYKSKNWPENGKLPYINSLLKENNIKYPKELAHDRSCGLVGGGYVIEEKIEGMPMLNQNCGLEVEKKVYVLLANLIKRVHNIPFEKYGYINNGNPEYDALSDYVEEITFDNLQALNKRGLVLVEDEKEFAKNLSAKFDKFNLKPVLCHGDLSIRNVIYNDGEVVLIDWDDAMALPAYVDISRMTFDMIHIHDENYNVLRKVFLNEYFGNEQYKKYDEFEKLYHIVVALDFLSCAIKKDDKSEHFNKLLTYTKQFIKDFKSEKLQKEKNN